MPFAESHDGTADVDDGTLVVPNTLSPVIMIPERLSKQAHETTTDPVTYRTSVAKSYAGIVINAAQSIVNFLTISEGIWDIDISFHGFTNLPTLGALAASLNLQAANGNPTTLFQLNASGAALTYANSKHFTLTIGKGNTETFRGVIEAAGAAQMNLVFCSVVANRLG